MTEATSTPAATVHGDVRTEEMLLNMGPQHPSTHGVFRVVIRTDGEVVIDAESHIGYLHRSFEKIFEKRTKTWNPIEGLKVKADNVDVEALNQLSPQLAVAVGLAAAT